MFAQRWLRLLPGRSQLALLAGIAFAVVTVIIFADLVMNKNAALVNNQRARTKVEQLAAQNARLQRDLERAQNDQQIVTLGYDYFGEIPKGVGVIVGEPETPVAGAVVEPVASPRQPIWAEWWQRLRQP